MIASIMRPATVLSCVAVLGACDDFEGTSELLVCNLDTGAQFAPVDLTVNYFITTTGDGFVIAATVGLDGGTFSLGRFTTPYTLSVPVRQGTALRMAAEASAGNGSVTIGFRGAPAGGLAQIAGFDSCTHS